MLKNFTNQEIEQNEIVKKYFLNAEYNGFDVKCNIYTGNFYLDSFNYFIINDNFFSFTNLFSRDNLQNNNHYFTKEFFENFLNKKENFKKFENVYVLGSNSADNYFSNLVQFFPRIFYNNKKKIRIAIHRNSSLKFRDFIKLILKNRGIEFSFIYLDEDFYFFHNSEIPQFFNFKHSIQVLKNFLISKTKEKNNSKIYVTREDSQYRKIINEADIIPILKSKGYKVINPRLYSIEEQINIFSNATKIVSPHGSNLTNIIFCRPGTEIYEIGPIFEKKFEKKFENRYKFIADINNLKYSRLITDSVKIQNHSDLAKRYISEDVLKSSNYYNNLIVNVNDFSNLL